MTPATTATTTCGRTSSSGNSTTNNEEEDDDQHNGNVTKINELTNNLDNHSHNQNLKFKRRASIKPTNTGN